MLEMSGLLKQDIFSRLDYDRVASNSWHSHLSPTHLLPDRGWYYF